MAKKGFKYENIAIYLSSIAFLIVLIITIIAICEALLAHGFLSSNSNLLYILFASFALIFISFALLLKSKRNLFVILILVFCIIFIFAMDIGNVLPFTTTLKVLPFSYALVLNGYCGACLHTSPLIIPFWYYVISIGPFLSYLFSLSAVIVILRYKKNKLLVRLTFLIIGILIFAFLFLLFYGNFFYGPR